MSLTVGIHRGIVIGNSRLIKNRWYGIEIDEANTSPDVSRIAGPGQMSLHALLPVHKLLKGCLLNDNGTVNYYLKPDDWSKKMDGTSSNLDGTDGMVKIEWPDFYYRVESNYPSSGKHQIKISQYSIPGFTRVPKHYVSAYQASVNRSTNKLASVKNATATYRGGHNNAVYDAASNTLLGKPATAINRTNFRTYERNRGTGWNAYGYSDRKWLFLLYAIEFATLNSQKAVNNTLTIDGYKQGGLGNGVTSANSTEWNNFNGYCPFIACGASDTLASGTGEVSVTVTDFGGSGVNRTFTVPRYRGHENPFSHIWEILDGVNLNIQSAGSGGESQLWTCDNPSQWQDANFDNYTKRGLINRTEGWMRNALLGPTAEILPTLATGGSATYYCDYYYTSYPESGSSLRMLIVGGSANSGASAGLVCSHTRCVPSDADAAVGSRLRFQAV